MKATNASLTFSDSPLSRLCNLCVTCAGLPGRHGGRVLRWRGRRALPLPLLQPGSLCLHRHAVRNPAGLETDRLQVRERPPFSLSSRFQQLFGKTLEQSRVIYRPVKVSPPPRAPCLFSGPASSLLFLPIPFNKRLCSIYAMLMELLGQPQKSRFG